MRILLLTLLTFVHLVAEEPERPALEPGIFSVSMEALIAQLNYFKSGFKPYPNEFTVDPKTNQVHIVLRNGTSESDLFIDLMYEGKFIQIMSVFPCSVKSDAKSIAEMSRLLNVLNIGITFPGLCVDEITRRVCYRLVLPTVDKKLTTDILMVAIKTPLSICHAVAPDVIGVADGTITFDQIQARVNKAGGAEAYVYALLSPLIGAPPSAST